MFPQWAMAYSFAMTQARGGLKSMIKIAAGESKVLHIIIADAISINGIDVNVTLIVLRNFLQRNLSKYDKITIEKDGFIFQSEIDKSKPKSRFYTKNGIEYTGRSKKTEWLDGIFKSLIKSPSIRARERTVSQEEKQPEIDNIPGQLQCLEVQDLVRPKLKWNSRNNIQVIQSDGNSYYLRLSKEKDSALLCTLHDETEITLSLTTPNLKTLQFSGNTIQLTTNVCNKPIEELTDMKYVEKGWNCKFKNGFQPSSWQFYTLKYAGNKLLLCHRPGFGKTINSILLAEKMRNSDPNKPKILLIIPGRKLLKQWIEVLKCMNIDLSHYIWMTYEIFLASQSASSKTSYPKYEQIHPDYIDKLQESIKWYQNGGQTPTRIKGYKKEQNNVIFCKYCGTAYSFGSNPPKYCSSNSLKDLLPNQVSEIRNIKHGKLVHRVWLGRNNYKDIRFTWNLNDDQIIFHCNCVGPAKFITGFTPTDIEYSSNIKTWGDYTAQFDNPNIVKDEAYYLYREHQQYQKFLDYKNSISNTPTELPKVMKLNYIEQQGFIYHQYKPPDGCIMVCDEIHKIVRSKIGIKMQSIWKYSLNTNYSLFLTATPLEGSDQFKQLHLLSEMLKMKRTYDMNMYKDNVLYEGFPPWHELQPMRKYKNIYDLTYRLRNKFSRHNTVEDIDMAVKSLYNEVRRGEESKYILDTTNLMELYTGKPITKWVDNGKKEDGQNLYQFLSADKRLFVNEALHTLYKPKTNNFGDSEFPTLQFKTNEKLYMDADITDGIYNINLDYHRANLVWKPPNMELRLVLSENDYYDVKIKNGTIVIGQNGDKSRTEIRNLQAAILSNQIPEKGVYLISKHDEDASAAVVSSYTIGKGLSSNGTSRNIEEPEATPLGADDDLKWLDVIPTLKQSDNEDRYKDIPYIPDLLGSKILHIVMTIEDAVREGKNVMVYHKNVEILRALQRGMSMRKHKFRNKEIINVDVKEGINTSLADDGDYDFSSSILLEHAKESAKRRFFKMPLEYRKKQNEMFNYKFSDDELQNIANLYDKNEWKTIFDDVLDSDALIHSNYKFFYLNFETQWQWNKKKDNILSVAKIFIKFAEYAENKDKQDVSQYLKLIDFIKDLKKIDLGRLTYEKRINFIEAMKLYRDIPAEKEYEKIIVGVCKPFYEAAIKINYEKIRHQRFKDKVKQIKLGKEQIKPVDSIDVFRTYYFSRYPGKGTRFRSTYKPPRIDEYEPIYEGRVAVTKPNGTVKWESKTVRRNNFDMPPLSFDWNAYIQKHKIFFDQVKKVKMPSKMYIKELDVSLLLLKRPFPETIKTHEDFFLMYIYVDQYFLQSLQSFINKKNTFLVGNKNMNQLSLSIISYTDNPKISNGRGPANINAKTWKESRSLVLDRLRKRWSGMDDQTVQFGLLEGDSVSNKDYPKFIQAFSEGYIDCLLVSPTGIEGLDFRSCSPSLMICIDPVSIAGKKDQFNGRTVRKNSHNTLPPHMRIVEELTFCTKEYSEQTKYEPPARDVYFDKTLKQLRALVLTSSGEKLKLIQEEIERRTSARNLENDINKLTNEIVEIEEEITEKKHNRKTLTDLVNRRNQLGNRLCELGDEDWINFVNQTVDDWKNYLIGETKTRTITRREKKIVRMDEISKWNSYFDTYVNISHVLCCKNLVFISPDEYKRHKKYMQERDLSFKHYCHVCEMSMDPVEGKCVNCSANLFKNGKPVYYHLMPIKGFIQPKDKINLRNTKAVDISDRNRVQRDRLEMALSLQSLEHVTNTRGDNTTKIVIQNDDRKKWFYRRVVNPSIAPYVDNRDWNEQMKRPDVEKFKKLCDFYKSEEEDISIPISVNPSFKFNIGDRVEVKLDNSREQEWIEGIIKDIIYSSNTPDWQDGYYYKIETKKGIKWSEVWDDSDIIKLDIIIEEEY